jgi:hypothetical protein
MNNPLPFSFQSLVSEPGDLTIGFIFIPFIPFIPVKFMPSRYETGMRRMEGMI